MNKFFSVLTFIFILFIIIFNYSRNAEANVSYDSFNLVAPGIVRTPVERFINIQDYSFKLKAIVLNIDKPFYRSSYNSRRNKIKAIVTNISLCIPRVIKYNYKKYENES